MQPEGQGGCRPPEAEAGGCSGVGASERLPHVCRGCGCPWLSGKEGGGPQRIARPSCLQPRVEAASGREQVPGQCSHTRRVFLAPRELRHRKAASPAGRQGALTLSPNRGMACL